MRRVLALAALAAGVSACNVAPNAQVATNQAEAGRGPWEVVPAAGTTNEVAAWRLNTQTGALQYCWAGGAAVVSCTAAKPPDPSGN